MVNALYLLCAILSFLFPYKLLKVLLPFGMCQRRVWGGRWLGGSASWSRWWPGTSPCPEGRCPVGSRPTQHHLPGGSLLGAHRYSFLPPSPPSSTALSSAWGPGHVQATRQVCPSECRDKKLTTPNVGGGG